MTILFIIPVLLLAFFSVIAVRAAMFKPRNEERKETELVEVDEGAALDRFKRMIQLKTISRPDPSMEDKQAFDGFRTLLEEAYPNVTKTCKREIIGTHGILYHWKGKSDKAPSVLMAHYDVVPVNEDEWQEPPFSGNVIDGELWGRGTLDTKGTLHGVMEAAEILIAQGFMPENDVYFAFGGNEEIFGNDAPSIVEEFKKRGVHPAFVLDEGGAIVDGVFPGVKKSAAVIGTAEKGVACIDLIAKGKGGHASAPAKRQALGTLGRALCAIEKSAMPFTLTKPALEMFDAMGRESTFAYRLLFANLWCFAPLLNLVCRLSGGELNALVRTTSALTMAEGSKAYNVLPAFAKAGINLRLISGDTSQAALERIKDIINDDNVEVRLVSAQEPSTVSLTGDEPWLRLKNAINAAYPDALVSPYLMLAGSDSRHYGAISEHVYRFSGMPLSKEQRGLIHNANERIPISHLKAYIRFFAQVLRGC